VWPLSPLRHSVDTAPPIAHDRGGEPYDCRPTAEYSGIGDYHDGAYECERVSPYTKTAGNVDADVMVLLQDWASHGVVQWRLRP
jgi:hypothetical protein